MSESLAEVEARAWATLAEAAEGDHPLRILTLATLGGDGWPEARSLVLRAVETEARRLEFHTDIRSAKWAEAADEGRATVLGWDAQSRQQLRLTGRLTRKGPESAEAARAWGVQSKWNHLTYSGPAPATPLKAPGAAEAGTPEAGRDNFGLLLFEALSLDWCQLERGNNRRAFFSYAGGEGATGSWVAT